MCGFIGKVSNYNFDNSELQKANNLLLCRGPDSKKIIEDFKDNFKYSLIFNRLAIVDLKSNADQPMVSRDKNYILMFNGEIFNHDHLRKELETKINFSTDHSDTEVVLNGLIEEGLSFIDKLRGQFSISFIDKKAKKIYLIRDRLGQKPLYYKLENNSLVFSSNLKSAIRADGKYNLDNLNIFEFLKYGAVSSDNTIFSTFKKIKPAQIMEFDFSRDRVLVKENIFWQIEDYVDDKPFLENEFFDLFSESLDVRNNADVPIANFLSGGIDSSAIVKNLYKKNDQINTFSIKVDHRDYDESKWSQLVSKQYNTNHTEITISSRILQKDIDESLLSLDEPYSDPSIVPSYLLSREISDYYKVAISGDGGDELLGGYKRTFDSLSLKSGIKNIVSSFYSLYPPVLGTGNYFLSKSNNLEIKYKSFLEDQNLLKLLGIQVEGVKDNIILNSGIEDYKQLLIADYKFFLPEMMLYKVDRTSMANSLEIRSPFVDHKLIEYIISRNTNYIDFGSSKSILKKYLSQDFDKDFINRSKQGFVFDIENWIFSNLNQINDILNTGEINSLIPTNFALKFNKHKTRINAHRIWKLYVLNHYLENII